MAFAMPSILSAWKAEEEGHQVLHNNLRQLNANDGKVALWGNAVPEFRFCANIPI
jgi:hypothetical protein